jgi:hypothetical protein
VHAALNRTESPRRPLREDFPERDDANWLKHTLVHPAGTAGWSIDYKPVTITLPAQGAGVLMAARAHADQRQDQALQPGGDARPYWAEYTIEARPPTACSTR